MNLRFPFVLVLALGVLAACESSPSGPTMPKSQSRSSASSGVQTTGAPGAPSATTTIDGRQLPPAPPKFAGVIKDSAQDSKPAWPARIVPPKGAPNVLLIMTDDQGY